MSLSFDAICSVIDFYVVMVKHRHVYFFASFKCVSHQSLQGQITWFPAAVLRCGAQQGKTPKPQ